MAKIRTLQILRGTTAQNDAYTGSIGELTMDTEKVEVRIHDGTTQGGKTIGAGGANLPILTHVFSDHKLNDISWLNADTFSWQSGDVYVAAYEHLVADAESGGLVYGWSSNPDAMVGFDRYTKTRHPVVGEKFYTSSVDGWVETGVTVTQIIDENTVVDSEGITRYCLSYSMLGTDSIEETIEGIRISYLRAEDGHKICMVDQEANVQALYEATGVAWYYVLDTANKQFKLPRTKFGFTGLRDSVGNYVEAGLPNITGECGAGNRGIITTASGCFQITSKQGTVSTNTSNERGNIIFDASLSSSVYGNSDTVQPKATQMYLYFYVGNFEREALEQTAGITSEQLNNKADTDLDNLTTAGKTNVFGCIVPNFDGKISIGLPANPTSSSGSTTFTCPNNGWIRIHANKTTAGHTLFLTVNGLEVGNFPAYGPAYVEFYLPVLKGDAISVRTDSTNTTWELAIQWFIPHKGL